jgi:hypothetical protein
MVLKDGWWVAGWRKLGKLEELGFRAGLSFGLLYVFETEHCPRCLNPPASS